MQPKDYSLLEAFGAGLPASHTIMGFEPSACRFVPRPDPLWRWDRSVLRDLIVWWQEGGTDAAYLFGPTGAGKSSALRNFCAALKIPMYEKTMHQGVEFEELVKVVDLSAGSTIPSYSYLPLAMGAEGYPGLFVPNEIDRADPGTVIALNEVLEGQPLLVHLGGLEPVEPQAPYFRIAGTGNSALAGDTVGSYVSVKQQDMA
ncbi:MAG: AAA family ATPase, partial [Steroidobacteraceae bacterium]